ncbi:hypothetical protein RC77_11570 [Pectobacterium brasiliense]|uniref:hypothetical protein n=1 Tax=Pectobacterium brasiliense TaxID=180957 RepID=UPI00057FC006|nr:hypothetical protein [Pectobacterium brasiliense]KHS68246.1 hypothetical protein RC77_11570 [Pectobacterium brasiliense]MDG0803992.1 hypothetical protein [Pectobacterium brasiliense]
MSDGLAGAVKQALEERIKNPLWGFIILAWFWFNWPNLALMFMSDAPVKFRIDYILSQEFFYLHYVAAPVLAGGLLAVVSPYAQWLLSKAHKWADDRYRDNVFKIKEKNLEDAISLSTLKVKADRAEDLEKAKSDAEIKIEVERGKREQLKTEELEAIKKALLDELENLRTSVSMQKEEIDKTLKEKVKIQDSIVESLLIMEKFFKVGDSNSIQSLKKEVENLYSTSEIEMSSIRNAIKAKRKLTDQQTITFFDRLDERVKKDRLNALAEGSLENE